MLQMYKQLYTKVLSFKAQTKKWEKKIKMVSHLAGFNLKTHKNEIGSMLYA